MRLTIAIPTYGRDSVLVDTLRHVLALDPPADEVLVVDQTPSHDEATQKQLDAWSNAGAIRWERLPQPSIPHAMNIALQRATGDVVLFLDDDLIPCRGLVANHLEAIATADAVVGQILQPGEKPIAVVPARPGDRMANLEFRFNSDAPATVTNVMAGNLSVRRERALAIGGFDENFGDTAYRFETDFAWRLADAGGVIRFEPTASIHHLKAERGGLRTWGNHLRSASPAHSTGDYYFAIKNLRPTALPLYILRRLRRSAFSRFEVTHPWWIPIKLIRELRALARAAALSRRSRSIM